MREPPDIGLSPLNLSVGEFLPLTMDTTRIATSKTRYKGKEKERYPQEIRSFFLYNRLI